MKQFSLCRHSAVFVAMLAFAGCKTFSPDGGMAPIAEIAGETLRKDVVAIRNESVAVAAYADVQRLLSKPLTVDAAVQVALLNNRGLQAAYNQLGIAEARAVGASLPPNPGFSIERLSGPVEIEIEKRIVGNILALATLPARAEIAADRFRQAQFATAEETLRFAAETRRSYYRAVAANETANFLSEAQAAAEAAAQLARRLGESGALNKLDQAREQVFYADITTQVATLRQRAMTERERLTRLMGLWGQDVDFRLPKALPLLPPKPRSLAYVETDAVRRRIDLQIARIEVDTLAKTYGLTQATRFVNLLFVEGKDRLSKSKDGTERIRDRGGSIEFQVPLFDFGEVRVREAENSYMRAVNELIDTAVTVRSQARDAYRSYRSSYDIALHYQREVLPLRKIISDETLLRYNAMQIDVFSLLAEARQRIAATAGAIDARRDFWLATTNLTTAVVGGGNNSSIEALSSPMASAVPAGGH